MAILWLERQETPLVILITGQIPSLCVAQNTRERLQIYSSYRTSAGYNQSHQRIHDNKWTEGKSGKRDGEKNTPFGETVVSLREAENARDHC